MEVDEQCCHQIKNKDNQVDFELGHRCSTLGYQFDHQINDLGHQFGQEQLLQAFLKSVEMCLILAGRGARG